MSLRHTFKGVLFVTTAVGALSLTVHAQTIAPADTGGDVETVIVSAPIVKRDAVSGVDEQCAAAQKIIPGVSPLKAIETLPGVVFETADPWGNNEQNESLFVHGFSTQQLGYTLDGVPLGDQQYGNYNGLSPHPRHHLRRISAVLTLEIGHRCAGH